MFPASRCRVVGEGSVEMAPRPKMCGAGGEGGGRHTLRRHMSHAPTNEKLMCWPFLPPPPCAGIRPTLGLNLPGVSRGLRGPSGTSSMVQRIWGPLEAVLAFGRFLNISKTPDFEFLGATLRSLPRARPRPEDPSRF